MQEQLLETIKIENGQIKNIEWHNKRFNTSREMLFSNTYPLNLKDFISAPKHGLYRCRILYQQNVEKVEYIPYTVKKIESLKIIQSDIEYKYKYNNRTALTTLIPKTYNDVIIEKNGFLSDTTIANIAFYDGTTWFTPKKPLLEGTMRAKLLSENFLKTKNIKKDEIRNYTHFALMNAMIGFQIQKEISIRL